MINKDYFKNQFIWYHDSGDSMKCVEIDGVKSLKVVEKDEPKKKRNKVVFKVNTCGICGSDIHYWDMGNPVGLVMGHEF